MKLGRVGTRNADTISHVNLWRSNGSGHCGRIDVFWKTDHTTSSNSSVQTANHSICSFIVVAEG